MDLFFSVTVIAFLGNLFRPRLLCMFNIWCILHSGSFCWHDSVCLSPYQ